MFSPYSFQPNWDKMTSLARDMLSWKKVHLSSQKLAKKHLHLARKVTSFVK